MVSVTLTQVQHIESIEHGTASDPDSIGSAVDRYQSVKFYNRNTWGTIALLLKPVIDITE